MPRDTSPRAWIGTLLADVRFPGTRTLKDRRGELRSLQDRLRNLGFSVAQTGPADLPARAWIAAGCVSSTLTGAQAMIDSAREVLGGCTAELGPVETCISLFDPGMEDSQ